MIIKLNNSILDEIITDIPEYNDYLSNIKNFFHLPSGKEHYKLLIYLSYQFKHQELYDIGTNEGASALALSSNPENTVLSYDVQSLILNDFSRKGNIKFNIMNIIDNVDHAIKMLQSPLIFLDTFHDGSFENLFYNFLINNNYKGILLLDDIKLNSNMENFWNSIKHEKYDITKYGHGSGTGIVFFDNQKIILE